MLKQFEVLSLVNKTEKCCVHCVFKLIFVLHFTYFKLVTVGSPTGANVADAVLKPWKT